jgi:hypothetical protein
LKIRLFRGGVDLTASMRMYAIEYVGSQKFMSCSPWMLHKQVSSGPCLTVWVLLHAWYPLCLTLSRKALKPSGSLFVVRSQGSTDQQRLHRRSSWHA